MFELQVACLETEQCVCKGWGIENTLTREEKSEAFIMRYILHQEKLQRGIYCVFFFFFQWSKLPLRELFC